jgi:hypothetical protein
MSEPTQENEQAILLWVIVAFLVTLELTWWLFDRIYQT